MHKLKPVSHVAGINSRICSQFAHYRGLQAGHGSCYNSLGTFEYYYGNGDKGGNLQARQHINGS